ncbi:MAG: hypothetical protein K2J12_07480 [Muribaculaceae bacterium]|nr:hypothetical protein [Muribaculaceae bacterium]
MCVNKVRIYDDKRGIYNYFNCGSCPACRQQLADRRSRRIRAHEPEGFTCYFITLTYRNEFVPYVKRSELYELSKNFYNTVDDIDYSVNIYRDNHVRSYRDRQIIKHGTKSIGKHEFTSYFSPSELNDLTTIRTLINRKQKRYKYDPDKVSIAFNSDAKNFVKRLRENISRYFQKRVELSYYYAPEYGPDNQRFHLHFLIWFPKGLSRSFVEQSVCKAWPYGDENRTKKYIQVARSPANYLASYVNCDASVSKFLQTNFRLRPSHSIAFGLSYDLFGFQNVLQAYEERKSFEYTTQYYDKNGRLVTLTLPYPRYVLDRYFPRFKYYNRITSDKIEQIYLFPERYFCVTKSPIRFGSKIQSTLYPSNIVDPFGKPLGFTKSEIQYYINRINRAYETYFKPLGIGRMTFAKLCRRFNDDYYIWLYYKSQSDVSLDMCLQSFYNLQDVNSSIVKNYTIDVYLNPNVEYNPNTYPIEIEATKKLLNKYNSNIKQRKVNFYG